MAQERLSMRQIKEILRLRLELGFSRRQTARSCRVSHSTVSEYFNACGYSSEFGFVPASGNNKLVVIKQGF